MASQDQELKTNGFSRLACDACESTNVIETLEGYVCQECGIVLEIQKLEYHRPYNSDIVQYERLDTTHVGSKYERMSSPHSVTFKRWEKIQSRKPNKETLEITARAEISRLFEELGLPKGYEEHVFTNFKKIRAKLQPGTKYRNPKKLIPIMIFHTFKVQGLSVDKLTLIGESIIDKKDFNSFLLQLKILDARYVTRNRRRYITRRIMEVVETFALGMPFFYLSKKIMDKLWEGIKNTTDDVVAGLACSISALCTKDCPATVSQICTHLGIRMSTMQSQVKKRIFERFKVPGFESLVKSSDILLKIMRKFKIIEDPEPKTGEETPEIIHLIMGKAQNVRSTNINGGDVINTTVSANCCFFYKGCEGSLMSLNLNVYEQEEWKKDFNAGEMNADASGEDMHSKEAKLFDCEIWHYKMGKGPPIIPLQ